MSDNFNSYDAYAESLATQNAGGVCKHCHSALGHYSFCGLINREAGEAERSTFDSVASAVLVISEEDATRLHALGVKW